MDIYILMAQRKERYDGEYGPEALACMSEYEHSDNPEYLDEQKAKADESGEFENTVILRLSADSRLIMRALRPSIEAVPTQVSEATS